MKGIHARMILINKCNTLTISVHGLNKSKIIYLTFKLYEKIKRLFTSHHLPYRDVIKDRDKVILIKRERVISSIEVSQVEINLDDYLSMSLKIYYRKQKRGKKFQGSL